MSSMELLQAIVLGAVQGITEFLPVSSSGHLILFPAFFGWEPFGLSFDVALHLGTLLAILIGLRTDLQALSRDLLRGERSARRLLLNIIVATLPIVIIGGLFGDVFEQTRSVTVVAIMLIVWGVFLALADRFTAVMRGQITSAGKVRPWQAIVIGLIQIFSLIPGTSRSGSTMTAGLMSGLDRQTAARFSFLIAIPAMLGAGVVTAVDVAQTGLDVALTPLALGFASAFVFGVIAIRFLLAFLRRASFLPFAIYRIALGIFLLFYL